MLGLAPRLPITITLLTAMTTNLLVRLRPLPVHRAGRVCFAFITAKIFRAALSQKTGWPSADFWDARAKRAAGRAGATRPEGLARRASAATATEQGSRFWVENDCCDWLSLGSASPRALRFGPGARMIGKAETEMRRMRRCRDQSNPTSITTFGGNV